MARYSKQEQANLRAIYKRERGNFQKAVSKARRAGIEVNVSYPAIPKNITPASIKSIIEAHNRWHYSTYHRQKKLSSTQKEYNPKIPKYQKTPDKRKDTVKKNNNHKKAPSIDYGTPNIFYEPPIDDIAPDPQEGYRPIDTPYTPTIEEPSKEESTTEVYDDLEPLGDNDWLDKSTGEILTTEQVLELYEDADADELYRIQSSVTEPTEDYGGSYGGNVLSDDEVADFEDYADDYMYDNLEKLAATHPNSAEFLKKQYDSLSGDARDAAMRRLNDMNYDDLEDMAVEGFYGGDSSNGSPAAAKIYSVIHQKNPDAEEMQNFINRLYDEDFNQARETYKQQAAELAGIKASIKRQHRK